MEQLYTEMNIEDVRLNRVVVTFTLISIALTALGLFGLAWYTVERRRREIALRKIHGSTRVQILGLLCRTFFGWVAVSIVIALPVAWWLTGEWLSGFVYKVDNSVWVLVATAAIAAAVTFLTVIVQSWRAASTNPAVAVKSE